jgi:hypothetical protein
MKKKQTPKQKYYGDVFDALMDIAVRHPRPPKKLLEAWDEVANFIGDVATGRRGHPRQSK